MSLDGSETPQMIVTAVGPADPESGYAPSTLLILAWDGVSERWTVAFDASKQPSYNTPPITGEPGPGLGEAGPAFTLVRFNEKSPDLIYWIGAAAGNGTILLVGAVDFANQVARQVWTFAGDNIIEGTEGTVRVVGAAPHQRVQIEAPLFTAYDAHCCQVRNYIFEVDPAKNYEIVKDDRPVVGAYVSVASEKPTVVNVRSSSPASFGGLRIGDEILGVVGKNATHLLGPEAFHEVALHRAGETIQLDVNRRGKRLKLSVTLAQWNEAWSDSYAIAQKLGLRRDDIMLL